MKLKITKYQAWRFSTDRRDGLKPCWSAPGRSLQDYEGFVPRYPLAPARDTFEEALADLIKCHEGFRNDNPEYPLHNRFDVVVPSPENQFAPGDLVREW